MSKLTICTKNKKMKVADNLYGIFLEDINRAVDGGLYPELLRNRSFEDSLLPVDCTLVDDGYAFESCTGWRDEFNGGEGLTKWVRESNIVKTSIPAWYSHKAEMKLDDSDTLNVQRKVSLAVGFDAGGRIENIGFCGVPQKVGETYNFYMFAKSEKPMKLQLIVGNENDICAELEIHSVEYQCYRASYTAKKNCKDGKFYLLSPEGGELHIGFISLMPAETFRGHGLRRDIAEMLENIHPSFLRFPGGCIVEGFTPSTAMRFKDTVGPVWERPGHLLMWHYRSFDGMGFHEYLQLCEDIGMEPLYVCNCGITCQARKEMFMTGQALDEMLQDVLDAIEYAIGTPDTKWGALRAKMGHPAPFKMNYIEIGNENWGLEYEERYQIFHKTISQKYPHIKFVANSHLEKKGISADIVDEHYYETAEWFAENTDLFHDRSRKGPEIFLGEVSVVRGYVGQLYGALGEAAFFTGVERNQDVVTMASYAPLLENVHYQAWSPNLIRFDNFASFGIPSYYIWKMFGSNRGDFVVDAQMETRRIARSVKGMSSLLGKPGLKFKNPLWNGSMATVTQEVMGHVILTEQNMEITEPDEEQLEESRRHNGAKLGEVLVVFGEEKAEAGCFQIDILPEKGREIVIGIFTSRIPPMAYVNDETHPPKAWNVENVQPFLWKIRSGSSCLIDQFAPGKPVLAKAICSIKADRMYHHFSYKTDLKKLWLYIDGELIHEVMIPSFAALNTVVTDTEKEVIVKLVNMGEEEENIAINLDCEVESEYCAYVLTGEKLAENSFEKPEHVRDWKYQFCGAGRSFTHTVPRLSVTVLVLKKR